MADDDPLPIDADALTHTMFVGDVIAGHGVTPFLEAAQAAGCKTAGGAEMVDSVQELMVTIDAILETDRRRCQRFNVDIGCAETRLAFSDSP